MQELGKVIEWNDDKGYGFIAPLEDKNNKLFFHIRAYHQQGRRPEIGELVHFKSGSSNDGRPRAEQVKRTVPPSRMSAAKPEPAARELPWPLVIAAIAAFTGVVAWAIYTGRTPIIAGFALAFINGATFIAYALDKHAAQRERQRIPEKTLHFLEAIGGWPAALFAQKTLRHKTRKQSYRITFWLAVAANCAALGILFWGH